MANYRFLVGLLFLLSGLVMLHPVSGQAAEEGAPAGEDLAAAPVIGARSCPSDTFLRPIST